MKLLAALAVSLAALAAPALAHEAPPAANNYGDPANWLCLPGKADNACDVDMTATVVNADGSTHVEAFEPATDAPIDCFYVYPTVSFDPGPLSDMIPGGEERRAVDQQFARFGSACRLFAPLYRQHTLAGLGALLAGNPPDAARSKTSYQDVVDAWNWYLESENKGRGVVLIGHSQGARMLTQLIPAEIEGRPVHRQLVSAFLIGANVGVEPGKDTGVMKETPLCRRADQTGCLVSYVTFRDTVPPPPDSRFGQVPGMEAACVNPANLAGGDGSLRAYFANGDDTTALRVAPPIWVADKVNPTTPFVTLPGLITSRCVNKGGFSYLEVQVNADPTDPRLDAIPGDLIIAGGVAAQWGLHLVDMNLGMGDMVALVREQSKAYLAKGS